MSAPALSLRDLAMGVRLLREVPPLVRHPVRLEEARRVLGTRLARREADLMALIRCATRLADAPYARLLRAAGLGYAEVERLVRKEGVEGALSALLRAGVYLTVAEFKGRSPVARGTVSFRLTPDALRNPRVPPSYVGQTSGSRGQRTPVPFSLAFARDRTVNNVLFLNARGVSPRNKPTGRFRAERPLAGCCGWRRWAGRPSAGSLRSTHARLA